MHQIGGFVAPWRVVAIVVAAPFMFGVDACCAGDCGPVPHFCRGCGARHIN
jgi:hypothetical protein